MKISSLHEYNLTTLMLPGIVRISFLTKLKNCCDISLLFSSWLRHQLTPVSCAASFSCLLLLSPACAQQTGLNINGN